MHYRYLKGFVANIKVRRNGGSLAINLPPAIVSSMHIEADDEVFIFQHDQGFVITAFDPSFDQARLIYEASARSKRNAFRDLARGCSLHCTNARPPHSG